MYETKVQDLLFIHCVFHNQGSIFQSTYMYAFAPTVHHPFPVIGHCTIKNHSSDSRNLLQGNLIKHVSDVILKMVTSSELSTVAEQKCAREEPRNIVVCCTY